MASETINKTELQEVKDMLKIQMYSNITINIIKIIFIIVLLMLFFVLGASWTFSTC